jgi:WD40 repeat protein
VGCADGPLSLYALADGARLWEATLAPDGVSAVAIGAGVVWTGGRAGSGWTVTSALDRRLKGWALDDGRELHALPGHESDVRGLVAVAGGRTLLSAGADARLHVWDAPAADAPRELPGDAEGMLYVDRVALAGEAIATGSDDGAVRLWARGSTVPLWRQRAHAPHPVSWVLSRPAARELFSVDFAGRVCRWTLDGAQLDAWAPVDAREGCETVGAALSPDGEWLWLVVDGPGDDETLLHRRFLRTGETRSTRLRGTSRTVEKFIARGRHDGEVAISHHARGCALFDVETGAVRSSVEDLPPEVSQLANGPDGTYLVGTETGAVLRWRPGGQAEQWAQLEAFVKAIRPMRDGCFAISTATCVVYLVEPDGRVVSSWAHRSWAQDLAPLDDGAIALGCSDGILRTIAPRC